MTKNLVGKIVFFVIGATCAACNDNPQGREVQVLGVGIMLTLIMVFVLDKLTVTSQGKVT